MNKRLVDISNVLNSLFECVFFLSGLLMYLYFQLISYHSFSIHSSDFEFNFFPFFPMQWIADLFKITNVEIATIIINIFFWISREVFILYFRICYYIYIIFI